MQSTCANGVVATCTCSGKEVPTSAEAGSPLFWSLSVHFMKLGGMKALLWPLGSTWGDAGLHSPSCLHWLFLSKLCVIVADRCLVFTKNNSDVGRSHMTRTNQSGRFTLMVYSQTETAKTKFRTFVRHHLSCVCCLHLISLSSPLFLLVASYWLLYIYQIPDLALITLWNSILTSCFLNLTYFTLEQITERHFALRGDWQK